MDKKGIHTEDSPQVKLHFIDWQDLVGAFLNDENPGTLEFEQDMVETDHDSQMGQLIPPRQWFKTA